MNPEQRIKTLEDEVKVLKNEVKTVLLDVREHYLELENPFSLHKAAPVQEPSVNNSNGGVAQDVNTTSPGETKTEKEELVVKEPPVDPPPATQEETGGRTSVAPRKIDLITIVGLTHWAGRAAARLGKAKTEALIEVYHTTGRLPPGFREVLIRLARLSDNENGDGQADSREYLSILIELDSLMNRDTQFEASLLSILSDEEGRQ